MIIKVLILNEIDFSVDRSFFPQRSNLVATLIIITHQKKKIGSANFIITVVLLIQNIFIAELCNILVIYKLIEYYMIIFLIKRLIIFTVNSDCTAALYFLSYCLKIISNRATLHQIKREILLIA